MWDPFAEFETAVLPNGLTVHAAHWPGRPWETMGFLVHNGASHDPVRLEGLSHLVEHLVSGNASISKKELLEFFKNCGGDVCQGDTGCHSTCYRFFVPKDQAILSQALSIFGSMLFSAKLENGIKNERQVIISEFHQYYPFKHEFDLDLRGHQAVFAGYWLGRMVIPLGSLKSISKISQYDIQTYYDTYYNPANMSIVGVGGLKLQELVQLLLESPFSINKKGTKTSLLEPVKEIALPKENRYIFKLSSHVKNTPVRVGGYRSIAAIPGDVNPYALMLLCDMLSEVLIDEIRECRGWTYHIEAISYNHHQFHEFSINCDGFALEALDEIENLIEVCIASMSDDYNLFEKIKQRALMSNFLVDPNGGGVCSDALDDLATHQRIISLAEYGEETRKVTMNDVRSILPWLRPDRRWTCIMKP